MFNVRYKNIIQTTVRHITPVRFGFLFILHGVQKRRHQAYGGNLEKRCTDKGVSLFYIIKQTKLLPVYLKLYKPKL